MSKKQKLYEAATIDPTIVLPDGKHYKVVKQRKALELQDMNGEKCCNIRTMDHQRYAIMKLIGGGSFANAYLALDAGAGKKLFEEHSDRKFVVVKKAINCDLADEVRIQEKLDHPNVVKLLDYLPRDEPRTKYAILEYVDGETLRELILKGHPSDSQIAAILEGLLNGLCHLQDMGISHGDLHSHNIMISKDGIVKIIDFGLARETETKTKTEEDEDEEEDDDDEDEEEDDDEEDDNDEDEGTDDLSIIALLILHMHGFQGNIPLDKYNYNSVQMYFSLIENENLKDFYDRVHERTIKESLNHPFIVDTLHSAEDLAQYVRNPNKSRFRPLPSLRAIFKQNSQQLLFNFQEVGKRINDPMISGGLINDDFVSFHNPNNRMVAEVSLFPDKIWTFTLAGARVITLFGSKWGKQVFLPCINLDDIGITQELNGNGNWGCHYYVLVVLSENDDTQPSQWGKWLEGCKDGPEACKEAVSKTTEICGKTSFALYQIVSSAT